MVVELMDGPLRGVLHELNMVPDGPFGDLINASYDPSKHGVPDGIGLIKHGKRHWYRIDKTTQNPFRAYFDKSESI